MAGKIISALSTCRDYCINYGSGNDDDNDNDDSDGDDDVAAAFCNERSLPSCSMEVLELGFEPKAWREPASKRGL